VAVGQVTPGPVFTTATFIGYVLAGISGAIAATLGIFLPGFIFVALTAPLIPRLRESPTLAAFLDGANVVSLALMAGVTWQLGQYAIDGLVPALIVLAALVLGVAGDRWRYCGAHLSKSLGLKFQQWLRSSFDAFLGSS
jgi:chromate transporter